MTVFFVFTVLEKFCCRIKKNILPLRRKIGDGEIRYSAISETSLMIQTQMLQRCMGVLIPMPCSRLKSRQGSRVRIIPRRLAAVILRLSRFVFK